MTPQERAREIRAVRECLRYVKTDAETFDLMLVSVHIGRAIAEADTILDELNSQTAADATNGEAAPPKRRRLGAQKRPASSAPPE